VHRPQLYTTTVDGAGRPDCHVNGMGRRGALLTCADRPFIALGQTLKAIARLSLPRRAPRLASHSRASLPMPRTCSTPLKGAMHRPRCRPLHFRRKSGAGSWRRLCRVCSPEVEARGRWMHFHLCAADEQGNVAVASACHGRPRAAPRAFAEGGGRRPKKPGHRERLSQTDGAGKLKIGTGRFTELKP
jgi:hypothetical protein